MVDSRSPDVYAGAHVPKSFSLPLNMLTAFAGTFLAYDQPPGLIVEDYSQIEETVRGLTMIGYDQVGYFLSGGLYAWETNGRGYDGRRRGIQSVEVCLGSMSACSHVE